MSSEVFFTEYSYLPSPKILESRFNEMKKRALEEANNNSTPPKGGVIDGGDLLAVKSFSTPPRDSPVILRRKSTLTKDNSLGAGDSQEILANYLTLSKVISTPNQNKPIVMKGSPGIIGNSNPPAPRCFPLFYFNYFHDLESIWWVIIWVLLECLKAGDEEYTEDYERKILQRRAVADEYFHTYKDGCKREDLLAGIWGLTRITHVVPDYFKGVLQAASIFREKLVSAYKEEEGKVDFPIKLKDGGLLHQDILEAFRTSSNRYFDVIPIDDVYSALLEKKSKGSKRSVGEDSEDERSVKRARQDFVYFTIGSII